MVNGKKVHCESDSHGLELPDEEQRGNVPALRRISIFVVLISSHIPAHALQNRPSFLRIPGRNPSIRFSAGPSGTQTASPSAFLPSAAPAGITHYTLQARSCAKREAQAPFGNPRFCRRVGLETHSALHILQPYKTQRNGAGQRAGMKQADIKNLFSGCNHLIYGL